MNSTALSHPHVFFGVLNWGLGHAARSVPLIREFLARGFRVTIGSDGGALHMLKEEFPGLSCVELPAYRPRYGNHANVLLALASQLPRFHQTIKAEHRLLSQLIKAESFDAIISDNRYGIRASHLPSILVTHQTGFMFRSASLRAFVNPRLRGMLAQFDEIWIPDFEDAEISLAGVMSHGPVSVAREFIGPLSRFGAVVSTTNGMSHSDPASHAPRHPELVSGSSVVSVVSRGKRGSPLAAVSHMVRNKAEMLNQVQHDAVPRDKYDVVALISGPEPGRTVFEKLLSKPLSQLNQKALLLRGLPGQGASSRLENVEIRDHMPSDQLACVVASAEVVIARAGYSTIMDLIALRKNALLIPTPGQPEQEYLATHLSQRGWFFFREQKKLSLSSDLEQLRSLSPQWPGAANNYSSAIDKLLSRLQPWPSPQMGEYSSVIRSE